MSDRDLYHEVEKGMEELLERLGFDKSFTYFNGQTGIWAMDKDRQTEVNFGIKVPDEEDIKNFEENLNE